MATVEIRDYTSVDDIYAHFLEEKEQVPELDGLDSTSSVAIWRLWGKITSQITWNFRQLLNLFYAEVLEINTTNQIGRADWYVEQAYKWQFGETLVYQDNILTYAEENEDAKIIKRASYQDVLHDYNGIPIKETILKVAKESNGEPVPLEASELQSFNQYINQIMFGGSFISTRSEPTDFIKIIADVYYNPLFVEDDVKQNVIVNLEAYFANLPFDASVEKNDIREVIRATEGVGDCELTTIETRTSSGSYTEMARKYIPFAGYIRVDDAFNLQDNLTLIADE